MFIETQEHSSILVVDPNPGLRQQLDEMFNGREDASLLSNSGNLPYLFHGCGDCELAIEKIRNAMAVEMPYQLLFVESRLDDGDGLQLISALWRIDPDLHVVLCSADEELSWQQIISILGESDQLLILQKPFSQLALRQIVHATLRKWQLNKQSQNVMKYMEQQIAERTQAIEKASRDLLQAEKLAAVGQLAAGIAHEINTPAQYVGDNLKAIGNFFSDISELLNFYRDLLLHLAPPELQARIAEREALIDLPFILGDAPVAIIQSQEGIGQISEIVQAMKSFSHIRNNASCSVNLNTALENTLLVTRSSYKNVADIKTDFAEIPNIECYPGELAQVFLNIIINAVHAIEDSKKGRGTISIATASTIDGIEIRISDTGNGIAENLRDRIFDPFFTTKTVGRGSGQGLNIAYRIIQQQHGGTLRFETEIGVGTTFIIHLHQHLPKNLRQHA